ncbi:HPP family protein [Sphingomonas endophytica]|uniref:Membrane protein n=1 Tax=Sphingomonas endophytica TaxID=869719 RepID=A0A147I5X9_9SPHN|nr:HPP family protein [Sphingomonas endophytica]KTT74152.1 membrane protein [Sphingomonas endophytica]
MKPFVSLLLAGAHWPTRLIACLGAAVCIALTFVVCAQLPLTRADLPIIVAPLGASAVLVFAVPASPLAQPWPVVGGNIVSSLVGVAMFQIVPQTALAAGLAVGGAILAMSLLRCLHPPGGAAALTAVIGSHGIHAAGFAFAFAPVGINSIALVSLGMFYHRMTGHSYPHRPAPPVAPGLHAADIDAALAELHETFDIAPGDLDALLTRAEAHAEARRGGRPLSTGAPRRGTPAS